MRRFIRSWFSGRVLTLLITHNFYRKAERERERERERVREKERERQKERERELD